MKLTHSSGSGIGSSLSRVQSRGVTWLAIFAPITLAYLSAMFYFVRENQGASGLLGLKPASAEAVLADLVVASLPMIVAIALYMRALARLRQLRRRAFVKNTQGQTLIHLITCPALIYRSNGTHIQLLWNADGLVEDGKRYPVPQDARLEPFNPDHFVAHGTP